MTGVFRGGAIEQAPSASDTASATPHCAVLLTFFIAIASISGRSCLSEAHFGAATNSIGRVYDHTIVRCQAGSELDDRTQVAFDRHWFDQYAVVGTHSRDREPLCVENQRARRHAERVRGAGRLQVYAAVIPRHQLTRAVVDDDLHQGR